MLSALVGLFGQSLEAIGYGKFLGNLLDRSQSQGSSLLTRCARLSRTIADRASWFANQPRYTQRDRVYLYSSDMQLDFVEVRLFWCSEIKNNLT